MATLTSGLQTIDLGTQGWNAIHTSNMQLTDTKLVNVYTATKIPGSTSLANNAGATTQTSETLTDSTSGVVSNTISAVSGSGDDAGINNALASLTDEVNKLKNDIASLVDYCNALKTSHNALLAELRKTTGCGIIAG